MGNRNGNQIRQKRLSTIEGKIMAHRLDNGDMGIYSYEEQQPWYLTKGEAVEIIIAVESLSEDNECLLWGFYKDGRFRLAGSVSVREVAVVEFVAPEDGAYRFFFLCGTLDSVHIRSIRFCK